MGKDIVIKVEHLSKQYSVMQDGEKIKFNALDDLSFEICHGERIGLIGSNGAGKSTLLSILSGYAQATGGALEINGQISAILEIGTSIQPEMTGRENLYLGGELYGLSKSEVDEKIPMIVDFIDIGEYIDQPMKTYSSGMKARLSFGMISYIHPEILIIDEVLGVGDSSFAEKSLNKLVELSYSGKVLLLVSHSMQTIRAFTNRCLWIEKGKLIMDGPSQEVTSAYLRATRKKEEDSLRQALKVRIEQTRGGYGADIEEFYLTNPTSTEQANLFDLYEDIQFHLSFTAKEELACPDVVLRIESLDGTPLLENSLSEDASALTPLKVGEKLCLSATLPKCDFFEGAYEVYCHIKNGDETVATALEVFEMINSQTDFNNKAFVFPEYQMEISPDSQGGHF